MLSSNKKYRKIFLAIGLVLAFILLLARFQIEVSSFSPKIVISTENLYRYFLLEEPQSTLGQFDRYFQKCKAAGLDSLILIPTPLVDLLLSDEVFVLSSDERSTVLRVPIDLHWDNVWDIVPVLQNSRRDHVDLRYDLPIRDLLKKDLFGRDFGLSSSNMIILKEHYAKRSIDGILIADDRILFDQQSINNENKTVQNVRWVFEPYQDIRSSARAILQYRRAFWERKNTLLIVPFFSEMVSLPGRWPGLTAFLKQVQKQVVDTYHPVFNLPEPIIKAITAILIFILIIILFDNIPGALIGASIFLLFDVNRVLSNIVLVSGVPFFSYLMSEAITGKLVKRREPWLELFSYLGGGILLISAFGTGHDWLFKEQTPHAVKLVILISYIAVFIPIQKQFKIIDLKKPIVWPDLIMFFLVLSVVGLFLFRSNSNLSSSMAGGWEMKVRDFLDSWMLFRPRFKEAFFGFPLMVLCFYFFRKNIGAPRMRAILLLLSFTSVISVFNTFFHYQSMVVVSLFRTLSGIIIGTGIGCLLVFLTGKVLKNRDLKRKLEALPGFRKN